MNVKELKPKKVATKPEWPKTITHGNASVKLYKALNKGYTSYTLAWKAADGKRKLKQFADEKEARKEADTTARHLHEGDIQVLQLKDTDRTIYIEAVEALKATGKRLDIAALEYKEAITALKAVPQVSVVEACRFYALHHGNRPNKTVREVADELLADRANRSKKYTNDLKFRLNRFASDINLYIADVTPQAIADWLKRLKLHPRSQSNFRAIITTLFRFAIDRGYLPEGRTAPEKVKVHNNDAGEIEIFTPEELRAIIAVASPETLPYLALGAFAGIRTAEIGRLNWEDIDLTAGFIELKAARTKTRARRLIPISDNLQAWIEHTSRTKGPVVTLKRPDETIGRICKAQKPPLEWKRNGLRHSYASYRYASIQNENTVAAELGNSPGMVHGHYRQLARPEQAKEWFSILPKEKNS
jgi:integrase